MNQAAAISQLREQGWSVEDEAGQAFRLPAAIAARYPRLPGALVGFQAGLTQCIDASQPTWFLCQCDYEGTCGSALRWDEWEQLSLEAARGDVSCGAEVRVFWDSHFPFLFSLHAGYYAGCTASDQFGQVGEGHEPGFEAALPIAGSFASFISTFTNAKRNAYGED